MRHRSFSLETGTYEKGGGRINLDTTDEELFRQVMEYINNVVDAENYRSMLIEVKKR